MDALSGGGGFWGVQPFRNYHQRRSWRSKASDSAEAAGRASYRFPLKQAATAASLALSGDTIAQLRGRWTKAKAVEHDSTSHSHDSFKDIVWTLFSDHDWLRALRMTSYGFLFYGPGSYAWYQYLDRCMPRPTVENIVMKGYSSSSSCSFHVIGLYILEFLFILNHKQITFFAVRLLPTAYYEREKIMY